MVKSSVRPHDSVRFRRACAADARGRPVCSIRRAGFGGVLGFHGIACPVCNKLLVLLLGAPFLMSYYEPVRLYVAAAGVLLLTTAVVREIVQVRRYRLGSTVAT